MTIAIEPSRFLLLCQSILHFAALLSLCLLSASLTKYCALIVLAISAMYYLTPLCRRWHKYPLLLNRDAHGHWTLEFSNGEHYEQLTLVKSIVTTHLLILYLGQEGQFVSTPILLLSDMINTDIMRKLRIGLQHGDLAE